MFQQEKPDGYVICSGETHSVKEFAELAFAVLDMNYKDYVVIDAEFFRPAEVNVLLGDSSKAKSKLGWEAQYSFEQLVEEMVKSDYDLESMNS
jgi:GDPmannose 4,6-dehydratase